MTGGGARGEATVAAERLPGGFRWVRRTQPPVDPSWLELVRGSGADEVKRTAKSRVVRARIGGEELYLKHYRPRNAATLLRYGFRTPLCLANFRMARRLARAGVGVVPHLAAAWRRRMGMLVESIQITAAAPGAERVDLWLRRRGAPESDRRRAAAALAGWLARLHAGGITPHDVNASNLLVAEDGRKGLAIVLLDLDNCRIRGRPASVRVFRRHARTLFWTLWEACEPRDMLRFLAAYRRARRLDRTEFRRLVRLAERRVRSEGGRLAQVGVRPLPAASIGGGR